MNQPPMNEVPPATFTRARRRTFRFRLLLSLFVLVIGVCLSWIWSYYSALAERDGLVRELRARGEPVWWSDVVTGLTPQGKDDSGAPLLLKAMWEIGWPFNAAKPSMHSRRLSALRDRNLEPRVLPEVQQALRTADQAFAFAEQAIERKPGLISSSFLKPDTVSMADIDGIQCASDLVRMLRWRIWDALARGDSSIAYRSAWQSLELSNQMENEPLLCLQVVRIGMLLGACERVELCATYSPVPNGEFERLDAALASVDERMRFDAALIGERAWRVALLEDSDQLAKELSEWNDYLVRRGLAITWAHRKWADVVASKAGLPARIKSQTALIRLIERFREDIDLGPMDPMKIDALCKDFQRQSAIHRLIEGSENFEIDFLRDFPGRVTSAHRRLLFARLALRLRRHFDKHGRLPDELNDVCDGAMPTIPLKWFLNQPIAFKPNAEGFRLETPESILRPEERVKVHETPLLSQFGLEIDFKTVTSLKDAGT